MTHKTTRKRGISAPVSVRLTNEERKELEAEADGKPLSVHIRNRLFGRSGQETEPRLSIDARQRLLGRILIRLGRSGLTQKIAALSEAASLGLMDITPETRAVLDNLLDETRQLRFDLLRGLGQRPNKDGGQ